MSFGTMKQDVLLKCPGLSPPQIEACINLAYRKLSQRWEWSALKFDFQLATKASESTGGVHFTNASTAVTAASSVSAAWTASTSYGFDGMWIKKETTPDYYQITGAVTTAATTSLYNAIALTSAYLGKTTTAAVSSGDSYIIFQNIYSISTNCETILSATYKDRLLEVDSISADKIDPDWSTTGPPERITDFGKIIDSANYSWTRRIKVMPIPDDIYPIKCVGYRRISNLLTNNDIPFLNEDLISTFAIVEGLRVKRIHNQHTVYQSTINDAIVEAEKTFAEQTHKDLQIKKTKGYVTHAEEIGREGHGWEWNLDHDSGGEYY